VPMPHNERLVRVCTAILRDPAQNDALDEWAESAGMGRRTFTRTFRRETGISFATWRQNVRLMEALSRLAVGQPVTTVALDVGYNSPSAFTAMFRRAFGSAPTQYIATIPGGKPHSSHH
jgi:AraC-like DNA-binding protein